MSVNYDALAEKYDLARTANLKIVELFSKETPLDGKNVLDFGCGTGNFAYAIKKLTNAEIYGVEPSDGMRERALDKGGIPVKKGDHTNIPYEDDFFDFIYMTDVIHHVPDINVMFGELKRVLKPDGFICILTESHQQIETRFYANYFPETVGVEKARYPDIPEIIKAAESAGLRTHKTVTTDAETKFIISPDFVKLVENKGYSMFHLIEDITYKNGLAALIEDYENKTEICENHGETLLWLRKGKAERNITYGGAISADNYNKLRTSVGWQTIHPELAQKGLDNTAFLIVAHDNGIPIGMARVITDYGYVVYIADVIVLPEYQRQGIGSIMMSKVMEYINDSIGAGQGKSINLMAAKGKEAFYRKFGFVERPSELYGPGMVQWIKR